MKCPGGKRILARERRALDGRGVEKGARVGSAETMLGGEAM